MRVWLAAILLMLAGAASADELRPGYLELTQQSATQWRATLKAPVKGGLAAYASPVMPGFCRPGPAVQRLSEGSLYSTRDYACSRSLVGAQVGLTGLDRTVSDALVRIAPQGAPVQAARLTAAAPAAEVAAKAGRGQVAATYFVLGIEHILEGYDHLLFVLALVLLVRGGWAVVRAVTAFTVAHSITLAGATFGWLGLAQQPVEIVIALSIVFLAVEIVKRDPAQPRLSERIPWLVAFLFGLLHGFGFAGALAEIGMPPGEVPLALLTFNLGVEAGQLAIVLVALAALALIDRTLPRRTAVVRQTTAYAIGGIASFWLIDRMLS